LRGKTTVMIDRETLETLRRMKSEMGFKSIDEVIRWLVMRERRLRMISALEEAWSNSPSNREVDELLKITRRLRKEGRWLTR